MGIRCFYRVASPLSHISVSPSKKLFLCASPSTDTAFPSSPITSMPYFIIVICVLVPSKVSQNQIPLTLRNSLGVKIQGADDIRATFLLKKTNIFYFVRHHCEWFAASLGLLQTCAVKNRTCTAFSNKIFERHKAPLAICTGENFEFLNICKCLNKPSKGNWRIHWVSMKLQQGGIVVTNGLSSFVTPHHPISIFEDPEWRQKKMHSCSERYGGSQAFAMRSCVWQKHFAPSPGRLEDSGLVARDHGGAHPARWLPPPPPGFQSRSPLTYFVRGIRGQ